MQISSKVALAISLVVAVTGALASTVALSKQERERHQDFRQTNFEAVQLLALAVAPAVAENRHERVQAVLDNISNFNERFPDVEEIEVVDPQGRIIASLDPRRYNERLGDVALVERVDDQEGFLSLEVPVRLKHPLGVIRARFSKARLRASLARQRLQGVGLVAAAMIFAGVLLFLLHRRLVAGRLSRLARVAGEIEGGNLGVAAETSGEDEIAELGEAFNQMAAAVRHYTEDLEQIIAERTSELEKANERLRRMATTDQLTDVANRRYFEESARRAIEVARRNERPLSLVLVDTDHFKSINDTWGHPVGDKVLQAVSAVLVANARQADLVARVGGEEFAVLMPEAGIGMAATAAERMRAALEADVRPRVPVLGDRDVTASFGVSSFDHAEDDLEQLLSTADEALYTSKAQGRNRVTVANRASESGEHPIERVSVSAPEGSEG